MGAASVIPVPPATGRIGWTVYARGTGEVLGWVRRAESCDPCYGRPAGTFCAIPRVGAGDPTVYETAAAAGLSIAEKV